MSGKTHRHQIGAITCIVLHEGPANAPPRELSVDMFQGRFPNATVDEINDAIQFMGEGRPPTMNALYIESAGTRILVDTGMGHTAGPDLGYIPAALQAEGIQVEDIDLVFITHFHGDHIFGLLNADGTPRYPNSRTVTTQTEWDYWMSETTLDAMGEEQAARLKNTFAPLQERLSLLNPGDSLAAGVTLVDLAGHTPGHCGLLIESNGERLLDVVDLLHSLAQFHYTHWHFVADTDGPLAEHNRKAALGRAADEHLLTLFYHLPFPGLGHITRPDEDTFAFEPL